MCNELFMIGGKCGCMNVVMRKGKRERAKKSESESAREGEREREREKAIGSYRRATKRGRTL